MSRRRSSPWFLRWTAAALLPLLASCAGGGGSTGTGIEALTTTQGTVTSTGTASRPSRSHSGAGVWLARVLELVGAPRIAAAVGGVEGVRVTIEGTSLAAVSDANGFFSLKGSFGGPITLLFSPDDGRPPRRFEVNVPRGGTLTLDDIRLDSPDGFARPNAQHLDFDGIVAATDCSGGSLSMVSNATPTDGNTYPVDVVGATLRDSDGNAIQCGDITGGDVLSVQGDVRSDGGIDCHEADRRPPGDGGPGGMH